MTGNMTKYILISIALIAILSCEKQEEIQANLYETAPVSYRDIDISVEAAGVIEPEATVEVKSKASGEILTINAETGDQVAEGTLLVQIDKRTPKNTVDQASADLDAAFARKKIAETQLNRTKNLMEKGIVTETELESTELELANAEALVISRQVDLENAKIALDDTDVRAPTTGTIIEKNVERGQVISSPTKDVGGGTILLKMADLSSVQVRTLVDETDIGKITASMPVTVSVAAYPQQPFDGEVLKIEPQATVEQNVTMFPVIIRLENKSGLLRPGMNAEVKINIAHAENVLAIPTIALRAERDIETTAMVLGITESQLRQLITPDNRKTQNVTNDNGNSETVRVGNRELQVPPGVDAELVRSAIKKRQNNQTPNDAERQAMRQLMQNSNIGRPTRRSSALNYQYGGNYWVLVVEDETLIPSAVKTGITDLEYSEIISGLEENADVLLLPSSGLIERQERMQERINRRMRLPGM
jgi:HlyD family secretion protein